MEKYLKHAIIANKGNFDFINKNKNRILNKHSPFIEKAIFESCKIKKTVVEKDEKEKFKKSFKFRSYFCTCL